MTIKTVTVRNPSRHTQMTRKASEDSLVFDIISERQIDAHGYKIPLCHEMHKEFYYPIKSQENMSCFPMKSR